MLLHRLAQTGALFDAHRLHYGKDDDDVLVWQPDTASMNPTISQAYIDREIEKDPEAGRAEWLGLFRENVSAAFPLEVIESCIVLGRMEIPDSPHVVCVKAGLGKSENNKKKFIGSIPPRFETLRCAKSL